jgi:hypothetical protein
MDKRICVVEKSLHALIVGPTSSDRVLERGQTLWWDGNDSAGHVIFEIDNILFRAERMPFLASVRLPV